MVVLVLSMEVLVNQIRLDNEDTLGSSVGSVDVITYEKKTVGSLSENIFNKRPDVEMVGSGFGP